MCTGAEIFGVVSSAFSLGKTLFGGEGGQAAAAPPAPQPAQAPPASQAAQTPSQPSIKKAMLPGAGDPTVLTGPGGIPEDKLLLGKATVLGS